MCKLFKFIFNNTKNEEDTVASIGLILREISDRINSNPFEKYCNDKSEYRPLNKIVFDLGIDINKLRVLSLIPVEDEGVYSISDNRSYISVKMDEYKRVYKDEKRELLIKAVRKMCEKFNDLSLEQKNELTLSYSITLSKVLEVVKGENVLMNDKVLKSVVEILELIQNDIDSYLKAIKESVVKDLSMELEYVKKIQETRKSFSF